MTTALPAPRRRQSARARTRAAASSVGVAVLRVSTKEQGDSGLGLDAQDTAVRTFAAAQGITLAAVLRDVCSGTVAPDEREGMGAALRMLREGTVGVLIVSKVDRLSRSNADFYATLDRANREGWAIRSACGLLDTTSGQGRILAGIAAFLAEIERQMIADRTRSALAALQRQGARLGAPVSTPEWVRQRIRALRLSGLTLAAIAAELNAEGVTTATGREWSGPNVRRVVESLRLDDAATLPGPVPRHLRVPA